jgi:hypothetical protein
MMYSSTFSGDPNGLGKSARTISASFIYTLSEVVVVDIECSAWFGSPTLRGGRR